MLRLQLLQCFWALPLLLLHRVRSAALSAVQIITFVTSLCLYEIHKLVCTCLTAEGSLQVCRFLLFSTQKWHSHSSFRKWRWSFLPCINSARRVFVKGQFQTLFRIIQSTSRLSQESTYPATLRGELGKTAASGEAGLLRRKDCKGYEAVNKRSRRRSSSM